MLVPLSLNGHRVHLFRDHGNGYATVALHRPEDKHLPYVVATYWPALGSTWSWGHYEAGSFSALRKFNEVASRNERRG